MNNSVLRLAVLSLPNHTPPSIAMATVLTGSQVTGYRAKVLLSSLSLECKGMRRHGRSAYAIVKEEYNLRGNKQSVYNQLKTILEATT